MNLRNHNLRWIVGLLAAVGVALVGAAPAAALTERPLPASDYTTHALCGAPAPGHAACFAVRLVPQTAAARAHATPIGVTVHHAVEPASAADGAYGLRPQDLHGAYSLPTAAPASQTVAIVDAFDDPTAEEDLAHYSQEFGLPSCTHADGCFTKVNQAGEESNYPSYESGWALEIALDVEIVHAVCQSCHILLVEANSSSTAALEVAENTAVSMGANEVSNSFGGPEPVGEGTAFDHPGTVITASTGDDGYLNWDSSSSGFAGHPNYPASSPDVVAVGGTRLSLNGGTWTGETVWNDGSTLGGGFGAGGGGCSEHPDAQPWQQAVPDWAEVGCGEKRAAADVAADADPYSGVAIYRAGSWWTVGGTSLASPIIASTFALAGGSGGVAYPAQTLYGHLGSGALHDVTSGSNGECTKAFDEVGETAGCTVAEEEQDCEAKLICRAAGGYDGPTGVGTPAGVAAFAPPAPSVSSVSPGAGHIGTEVTIEGEHLQGVGKVEFGGTAATHVVEVSATELTATAPGHAPAQVDVTVTTGGGTSATSSADKFEYLQLPAVEGVAPAAGPIAGGTAVTITGRDLGGASAVTFGGTAATSFTAVSDGEISATAPAHAEGRVDVVVTTPAGTSSLEPADGFNYLATPGNTAPPTISGSTTEGESLNADPGGWEHAGAFAYEWLRCDSVGAGCVPIAGATGSSHTLTSADVGHTLEVRVSTSTPGGSASAISAATPVVSAQPPTGSGVATGSGGSSGGGGAGALAPAVASGKAVAAARAPVKGGRAAVALHCTGAGPCSGTLLLRVAVPGKPDANRRTPHVTLLTIGRARFSIAAGRGATVSVHLTPKGRALLRKAGKKPLHVQLAGTGLTHRRLKLVG